VLAEESPATREQRGRGARLTPERVSHLNLREIVHVPKRKCDPLPGRHVSQGNPEGGPESESVRRLVGLTPHPRLAIAPSILKGHLAAAPEPTGTRRAKRLPDRNPRTHASKRSGSRSLGSPRSTSTATSWPTSPAASRSCRTAAASGNAMRPTRRTSISAAAGSPALARSISVSGESSGIARQVRAAGGFLARTPQVRVSSATASTCGVCGNMSSGRTRSRR